MQNVLLIYCLIKACLLIYISVAAGELSLLIFLVINV